MREVVSKGELTPLLKDIIWNKLTRNKVGIKSRGGLFITLIELE